MHIDCDRLLLACGPWTHEVFHTLFPSSTCNLRAETDASNWVILHPICPVVSLESVALTTAFVSVCDTETEFTGRQDGTMWIRGRMVHAVLPPPGQTAAPVDASVAVL